MFDALIVADRSGRVLGGRGVFSVPPALVTMACEQRMQTNVAEPGGIGFRVFGMPLNILGRADADASISTSDWRWAIIGVQREAAFAAEARQLPEWVVVWFVLLLSITLFSWPLLNVLSLHQREAVRMRTVLLLHASVLALLGTLTLWTCRHFGERRLERARGDRLKGVALGIQAHIERELAKIGTQLQGLDKRLHHDATNQSPHVANRTRILESLLDPSTNAYPELIRVGWIHKRTGMQLLKWTVNSNDTPLISVANRDYFKVIARGDGFPPRTIPGLPGSQPFFLESIYSSNTGEHLATFSRLSDNDPQLISTLDCKLVAVSKAVLPHKMGFCILDRSGRALFHSDGRRVQRENFVDECERDDDLRAALGAGQSKVIRVRYCGEYHSVSLHPWQATGWTVVTFEPVWKVEMPLWHACYLAAWACTGCTVALASLGLGLFFATARTGGRDGRLSAAVRSLGWLRPHAGQARACWQLGTLNVALGAMAWGVSQPLAELGWDWIPILCCPLAGLLAWGTWHLARTRKQTNAKDGFPQGGLPPASPADVRATAACNTTLLLLISALPVWLVFDSVLEEDLRRSARHQQAELARGIEARQADISDGLARRGLASEPDPGPKGQGEGSLAKFYKHRTRRHWDFYLKPVFDGAEPFSVIHALRVRDDPRRAGFQPGHWLDWVPSARGDDEADMVGFSRDMDVSFWQWQLDDPEAVGRIQPPMVAMAARVPWLKDLAAGTNSAGVKVAGALIVPAVAPVGDDPPWFYVVLAGIGLVGVAACIHHHAGRRLWYFGIRPVSAALGGELATARGGSFRRDLLLGTSRESLAKRAFQLASRLAAGGPIVELDLHKEEVAQAIMQGRLPDPLKRPFQVLVLLNLDAGPTPGEDGSSAWTQHRRRMLEWARQISSGHVVVTTTRNPLNFTMGDSEEHRAREEREWRQLLKEWRIQVVHASAGEWEGRTTAARVRALWDMCSPDERWVLHCLALGRAVPCHNEALWYVLEPERGLLALSGRLRFVDREMWDLARRSEVGPATAGSLEDDSPVLWERLRGPLALLLGLGAVFLFVTQREAFNLAVAALTGVGAALLPLISKLEAIWKPRDRSPNAKT